MSTIQDLRDVLREHADSVSDDTLPSLADNARRQAVGIRRRRMAGAVAAAAAVTALAGLAILNVDSLDGSRGEVPPSGDKTVHVPVDESFAGRTLIDSRSTNGADELTLTLDTEVPTEWNVSCWGLGPGYTLHVEIDEGTFPGERPCRDERPADPEVTYQLDSRYPTGEHTIRAWITGGAMSVTDLESAVLVISVYELPDPVATVAGIDVFDEQFFFEKIYSLDKYDESNPGDRTLKSSYRQLTDESVAIQILATGSGDNPVKLYIDGLYQGELTIPDNYIWGTRTLGPHTVELRISGAVPADARLGVAWRPFTRKAP
ncbi:MAG TPA: hypothetical protein VLI04_04435 [Nocardioidaceae bacterium]|nr:hypothetical protein [Nocardioidaceae bacterium]